MYMCVYMNCMCVLIQAMCVHGDWDLVVAA